MAKSVEKKPQVDIQVRPRKINIDLDGDSATLIPVDRHRCKVEMLSRRGGLGGFASMIIAFDDLEHALTLCRREAQEFFR